MRSTESAPRPRGFELASALLALACFAAPARAASGVPHQELAQRFLGEHGLAGKEPEEIELGELLERDFTLARLGLFDLYVPPEATTGKGAAEELRDVCAALFDAQAHWLAWLEPGPTSAGSLRADAEALREWARKWKPAEVERAAHADSHELVEELGASSELVAANERLRDQLVERGGPLGLTRDPGASVPLRIALAPTRRDFVEFLCFAGWWRPELRSIYWQPGIEGWLEFHVDDVHVYAMQYQAVGKPADQWDAGTEVNEKNPRRLEEQLTQLALNQLLRSYYETSLPGSLIGGLSLELVIDQFGEVDTRVDGDLRSNQTSDRAMFVPGGRSEGGTLPPDEAGSRWRVDKGKDRFVRVLRQAQKAGAKSKEGSPNKQARFELKGADGSESAIVSAPMFGAAAQAPNVPAALQGDLLEFLRAYKTAFLHWLRTEAELPGRAGKDSKEAPEARFARFLIAMAQPENAARLDEVVVEVFGAPLSDAAADEECLEGRFLDWLASQKGR